MMDAFAGHFSVWLQDIAMHLSNITWLWVEILIGIPVLVALLARHLICFLVSFLLASIALAIWMTPGSPATILLIGAYVGTLLAAVSAISASRKRRKDRIDLETLKSEISGLSTVEQRRLVSDLKAALEGPTS